MLQALGVHVSRGGQAVLRDVSLTLNAGETVGLLGANGAGKSTLLAVLADELSPARGMASIDGVALSDLSSARQARRRAVLPQKPSLAFDLSVIEVVAMGAYPFPELAPDAVRALVRTALEQADSLAFLHRHYLDLSGGEQQRIQFARTLVQCLAGRVAGDSRYLLLDEPTASQDPPHQQQLLRTASALAQSERLGVLVVLHDVNLAARWCDRLLLLAQGRLVADGPPAEVLTELLLREVYGMGARVLPHPLIAGRPLILFE